MAGVWWKMMPSECLWLPGRLIIHQHLIFKMNLFGYKNNRTICWLLYVFCIKRSSKWFSLNLDLIFINEFYWKGEQLKPYPRFLLSDFPLHLIDQQVKNSFLSWWNKSHRTISRNWNVRDHCRKTWLLKWIERFEEIFWHWIIINNLFRSSNSMT